MEATDERQTLVWWSLLGFLSLLFKQVLREDEVALMFYIELQLFLVHVEGIFVEKVV